MLRQGAVGTDAKQFLPDNPAGERDEPVLEVARAELIEIFDFVWLETWGQRIERVVIARAMGVPHGGAKVEPRTQARRGSERLDERGLVEFAVVLIDLAEAAELLLAAIVVAVAVFISRN